MNSAEIFVGVFCNQPVPYTDFLQISVFKTGEEKDQFV